MKRNGVFRKMNAFALAALALIGFSSSTQKVTNTSQPQQVNQQNKKAATAPVSEVNQINNPSHIGGVAMQGWQDNYGIPPHIYGTYHVKPRTHKRTIKK